MTRYVYVRDEVRAAVIEECARYLEKIGARYHEGRDLPAHLRALAPHSTSTIPLTSCTCGADDGDPLDHHDISCPLAISTRSRTVAHEDCLNCQCQPDERCKP